MDGTLVEQEAESKTRIGDEGVCSGEEASVGGIMRVRNQRGIK